MNERRFIKTTAGTYTVSGEITEQQIIEQASNLLFEELEREPITSTREARRYLELKLGLEHQENFAVLYLDASHKLLKFNIEFVGTVDSASIYPRIILQKCLMLGTCNTVIIAHNHPSGNLDVSQADKNITNQIKDVLALCDIKLLDSLVVSKEGSVSLAELGGI